MAQNDQWSILIRSIKFALQSRVTVATKAGAGGSCSSVSLSSAQPPVVWTCQFGLVSRLNYGNYESMSGIISASAPVTLTFTAFDTEQGYDEVTVSSCPTTACSTTVLLLDHYSGSTIPSPLSSSTGIMLIQWQSDLSVTSTGWSATWAGSPAGVSMS